MLKQKYSYNKIFERGERFKPERFISAGSIYTSYTLTYVIEKAKCKTSMKNVVRDLMVYISRLTISVRKGYYSCPAGNSGYCNHVIALLFELAEYSLSLFENIPEEIFCASRLREWDIQSHKTKTTKNPLNIYKHS